LQIPFSISDLFQIVDDFVVDEWFKFFSVIFLFKPQKQFSLKNSYPEIFFKKTKISLKAVQF
jgi:hypothetical protein